MLDFKHFKFNNLYFISRFICIVHLDLFDFSILDSLMYHFDSKQYRLENGLSVRIDHGRALVKI